jgi:hypothetical protein
LPQQIGETELRIQAATRITQVLCDELGQPDLEIPALSVTGVRRCEAGGVEEHGGEDGMMNVLVLGGSGCSGQW